MNRFVRKLKGYLSIRITKIKILLQFFSGKKNKDGRQVVFDIKNQSDFSRHLVSPTRFFLISEYSVVFRFRVNFYRLLSFYYTLISREPNVRIAFRKPSKYEFYFTNAPKFPEDIILKSDYYGLEAFAEKSHRFPPPMHPLVYKKANYLALKPIFTLRESGKKIFRIIFAGNLNYNEYKSFEWGKEYYTNRVKLVKVILDTFGKKVFIPKSYDELENGSDAEICIIDRENFSLDLIDYFKFYSSGQFSFCPPGIRQPFCHNLVESMSVGCIPILQYAHILPPPLENGINCFTYNSIETLLMTIEKIIEIEKDGIKRMNQNVIKYYDDYLEPHSVIKNFENAMKRGCKTIYMPAGT